MGQHTPGPWDYDMGDFTVFQPETGDQIVEMWGDQPQEEIEANARLIVASPDMLAALKVAEAVLEEAHANCGGGEDTIFFDPLEKVRAAIVRAEDIS